MIEGSCTSKQDSYIITSYSGHVLPVEYQALVYSKWLRSLRFGNDLFKKISSNEYYQIYHQFIGNLLKKPDCTVRIASLSDNKDVVLGFAVIREDVLDYVYVHKDNRLLGIGTKLIPDNITTFSHITNTVANILKPVPDEQMFIFKHWKLKFNPFA